MGIKSLMDNIIVAFDCGKKVTPSMKKIQDAYDAQFPSHFNTKLMNGNLEDWAKEGVLLLNAALTVRKGEPKSHLKHWNPFTIEVIKILNRRSQELYNLPPPIFMLWGNFAHQYEILLSDEIPRIKIEHPAAAIYAKRQWRHNNCFLDTNAKLKELGVEPVNW
jgi:uracil-DNA glycosylase